MKQSQFNYELPSNLISEYPMTIRDEARLMIVNRKTQNFEHRKFKELTDYFGEQDVLIVNNTKVFPARLYGNKEKTGAKIEVFLLRELNKQMRLWDVMVDPARKIRVGNKIFFGDDGMLVAEVIDNTTSRGRTIRFIFDGGEEEFRKLLYSLGETPLPKYIKRSPDERDKERYQTLFAKKDGAVAVPTAGLHFSKELIKRLQIQGAEFAEITLHTGLASFNPIDVEDLGKYKMDAEYFQIDEEAVKIVNKGVSKGKNICAVGTTVMRAIESAVTVEKQLKPAEGWTNLFVHPPYDFSIATSMVTNFHLPKSCLLIMAAAFTGYDLIMEAYEIAKKEKYRFYTYGDAMLIL